MQVNAFSITGGRQTGLRAKIAATLPVAFTALVAISLFAGGIASAAEPPQTSDPGQAYEPGQTYKSGKYNVPPVDDPAAAAAPPNANTFLPVPNQNAPGGDAGAAAADTPFNLNVPKPEADFGNLLANLRTPLPAQDPYSQISTPDTTSSYSTAAPVDLQPQDPTAPHTAP
jgi:hypothetical protein